MAEQRRLVINLHDEAWTFIDRVKQREGITYTEAIRRAIALYKFVADAQANGGRLEILDKNGRVSTVVFVL